MKISVDKILPNPEQPRMEFDAAEMDRLVESIAEHGVIQPVVVEKSSGYYILIDGERRWRAAKTAGLLAIPAYVIPEQSGSDLCRVVADSRERLTRALVANIQRADLNPIEEARAYRRMVDELGMKISGIARTVGVSQTRVNQRLKLLELEEEIQAHIIAGYLPKDERAVDALLSLPAGEIRLKLARQAAYKRMTVKGLIEACIRLNKYLEEKTERKQDSSDHSIPAIRTAVHRDPLNKQRWDALAQVGKLPPWNMVEISARDTCESCAWYDQASEAICKPCPLPQMLMLIIGRTKQ